MDDCFEKKCCMSDHELALLAEKESNYSHGHSHGGVVHGHSHHSHGSSETKSVKSKADHKTVWTYLNPLKTSTSLHNVKEETKNSSKTKSNPDLSKDKETILKKDYQKGGTSSAVKKSTRTTTPPPLHNHHSNDEDESSDDDEDKKVRKPMI